MAVTELVDNGESGRGSIRGSARTEKRVLLVDTYDGWESDDGIPKYGDAHPDNNLLKVSLIDYEGYGGLSESATTVCKYAMCKVTVTYSSNPVNDFTYSSGDMSAELLSIGSTGKFQISGEDVDHPRTIPVAMDRFVIPRRALTRPAATIYSKLGCINNAAWQPDDYEYPAGTVWFAGCPYQHIWNPDTKQIEVEMQYTFIYNPHGWNYAYDPSTDNWDVVLPLSFIAVSFAGFPA